ncbi:MAG TPA: hypothetical protein VGC04_08240 [Cellulomonas sp.]
MVAAAVTLVVASSVSASADDHSISFDFTGPGYSIAALSPVGQNGWSTDTRSTVPAYDFTLANLSGYPDAGLGATGVALRFSNAVTGSAIGQLVSPYLTATAGEPASGATSNTFTSSYTVASATGTYQDGLAVEVSIGHATDRAGGVLVFRHTGGGLAIDTMWEPSSGTSDDTAQWRSARIAGPAAGGLWDPTVPHQVSTVIHFVTGGPDQVEVVVDGRRAAVVPDWEYYQRLTTAPPAVPEKAVRNLNFRVARSGASDTGIGYTSLTSPVPATAGGGFLFADITYASSTASWTSTAPSGEPVRDLTAPAIPPMDPLAAGVVTQEGANVALALGAGFAGQQIGTYLVSANGDSTFLGWSPADAQGTTAYAIPTAAAEGVYSLVSYDTTSGLVGWVDEAVTVAPATTPPPTTEPTQPPTTEPTAPLAPPTSASPLPTDPPVLTATPDPDPAGTVPLEDTSAITGQSLVVSFPIGTFDPFENVYATWYSTPMFGGWFQADADGALNATITVPGALVAGSHTLEFTGATSGAVLASRVTLVDPAAADVSELADTGADAQAYAILALVAFGSGAVLLAVARRRRVRA